MQWDPIFRTVRINPQFLTADQVFDSMLTVSSRTARLRCFLVADSSCASYSVISSISRSLLSSCVVFLGGPYVGRYADLQ